MILVDTSVWIDFFAGTPSPQARLLQRLITEDQDIALTSLILMEILQGIREDSVFDETMVALLAFPFIEPQGIRTYLKAAQISRRCRKLGRAIRHGVDILIAAIALEYGTTLLHRDRDFETIAACTPLRVCQIHHR